MSKFSSEYQNYLKSFDWRIKRVAFINASPFCRACGSNKNLCVHHLSYKNLFNETAEDVVVLCEVCHKKVHKKHNQKKNFKSLLVVTFSFIRDYKKRSLTKADKKINRKASFRRSEFKARKKFDLIKAEREIKAEERKLKTQFTKKLTKTD